MYFLNEKDMRFIAAASLALIAAIAMAASSSATTLDTLQRGYYEINDVYVTSNDNYVVGQIPGVTPVDSHHDFFSFDLSGISGPITGATLHLYEPNFGYSSPNTFETLQIYVYTGDVAALNAGGTLPGAYAGLVSGPLAGTFNVSGANDGTFIDIVLNNSAIAALNAAAGGLIAFGGELPGIPDGTNDYRYVFGWSGNDTPNPGDGNTQLLLSIPEPSSLALVAAALASLGLARRRSRRKQA